MAPQGFNVAVNKQNSVPRNLFTLTLPTKRKRAKKKKKRPGSNGIILKPNNTISANAQPSNKLDVNFDDDVIVIGSDDSREAKDVTDDDVVLVNSPGSTIILSDSEDEEHGPKRSKNILNKAEPSNDAGHDDIVINIHQTLSIEHIMNGETSATRQHLDAKRTQAMINDKSDRVDDKFEYLRTHGYPQSWTAEMIKYYTEPCERSRTFDCAKIMRNFKTKPSDWWINRADMVGPSKRKSGDRCLKCNKPGHTFKNCPKKIVCYVCGQHNHMYLDCPNTLCLTCGRPAKKNLRSCNYCEKFLTNNRPCNLCGQLYHNEVLCPSKWRKYLILNTSNQPAKQNSRKYCYNCAEMGHFGFECTLTSASEYPPENPFKSVLFDPNVYSGSDELNNNRIRVIFLSKKKANLLATEAGNQFLKNFANISNVRLEFFQGARDYIRIIGTENQKRNFRNDFDEWKFVFKNTTAHDFR